MSLYTLGKWAPGYLALATDKSRWVQTEMGDLAAKSWNYPGKPPLTVSQSVEGVLQVVSQISCAD